ncbi:hypothetical protein ALO40_04566 [Pseudomonas syringae pv. viburni]|uniref:Uncharacterized protein n=1 Tax=Pseudomonas syringae pv. viburni TaxID=251703 RepID=A0A0Q0JFR2_9PSED|nr:hypothetical protein ALO40_04566 [Pseudomonas syringae pv. viburni]
MGRPATVIVLSEAEKAEPLRRVKQRKGAQDACVRAEIIRKRLMNPTFPAGN